MKSARRRTGSVPWSMACSISARRLVMRGAIAKSRVAIPISHGTTLRNVWVDPSKSRAVPVMDPRKHVGTSERNSSLCVLNSSRKPRMPPSELGRTPTVDETLAVSVGMPRASSVGKLRKVPPPAMPFDIPAAIPATQKMTSRQLRGSALATIAATLLRDCHLEGDRTIELGHHPELRNRVATVSIPRMRASAFDSSPWPLEMHCDVVRRWAPAEVRTLYS